MLSRATRVALCLSLAALPVHGLSLDVDSTDSIKSAAKTVAQALVGLYDGNEPGNPIGVYGAPYYWWSSGAVWESLVDYWSLTGDETHNDLVHQALVAQLGQNYDFLSPNWTSTMGNDDQNVWAFAALTAAERNFTAPPSGAPSWAEIAANVFGTQVPRWDNETCGGGLRWQILLYNVGYDYKNVAANGYFFQVAARLAHLTGNQTYSDWAKTSFDWMTKVGFVTSDYKVYDGAHVSNDCTDIDKLQFGLNAGTVLHGAAVMYNLTGGDSKWADAVKGLVNETTSFFFEDGVLKEVACEDYNTCNTDLRFSKGMLARDLARTARLAPFTAATISPLLKSSAKSAASTACDGSDGSCGFTWAGDTKNSTKDLGSQYSGLEIIQAGLSPLYSTPANSSSAGGSTSQGGSSSQGGNTTTGGTGKNAGASLKVGIHTALGAAALLVAHMLFL
ncbi:glycoside hydrolase [Thozetella sp. PMI_491]|nr:glycoside hydrolase [Thozetella sp. PMI_491]